MFVAFEIAHCNTQKDNFLKNSLRQNLGLVYNRIKIKRHFDYCWIPSEFHKKYALKLGFKKNEIKLSIITSLLTSLLLIPLMSILYSPET